MVCSWIKPIKENFLAPNLRKVAPKGWLRWNVLKEIVQDYVGRLEIQTPSLDQKVNNLSGGNQQKVLFGEWLATEPEVLIVDEPTRGIDVGTKAEIHRLLRNLAEQGKAVMVISSDLPEALRISDRIAVMRRGIWSDLSLALRPPKKTSWNWQPAQLLIRMGRRLKSNEFSIYTTF